jgi:hypothetical protein
MFGNFMEMVLLKVKDGSSLLDGRNPTVHTIIRQS